MGEVTLETSEQINELVAALCKAQGEFRTVRKGADNPFFKSRYAPLESIIEAAREPLSSHALAVVQPATTSNGTTVRVLTRLMHESGQWMQSHLELTAHDPKPQVIGSAITYARRYALQSMLCIATADEDDDGEAAMGRKVGSNVAEIAVTAIRKAGSLAALQSLLDTPTIKSVGTLSEDERRNVRREIGNRAFALVAVALHDATPEQAEQLWEQAKRLGITAEQSDELTRIAGGSNGRDKDDGATGQVEDTSPVQDAAGEAAAAGAAVGDRDSQGDIF